MSKSEEEGNIGEDASQVPSTYNCVKDESLHYRGSQINNGYVMEVCITCGKIFKLEKSPELTAKDLRIKELQRELKDREDYIFLAWDALGIKPTGRYLSEEIKAVIGRMRQALKSTWQHKCSDGVGGCIAISASEVEEALESPAPQGLCSHKTPDKNCWFCNVKSSSEERFRIAKAFAERERSQGLGKKDDGLREEIKKRCSWDLSIGCSPDNPKNKDFFEADVSKIVEFIRTERRGGV